MARKMRLSNLFWKFLLLYGGLILALATAFLLMVGQWQRDDLTQRTRAHLFTLATQMRSELEREWPGAELSVHVARMAQQSGLRVTIVDAEGLVLADSHESPERMNDHSNRPELADAREKGWGEAVRNSPTLGVVMNYLALPIQRDNQAIGYVRVAIDSRVINQAAVSRQRTLWCAALGVGALAVLVTYFCVRQITLPVKQLTASVRAMSEGNYQQAVVNRSRDEVGELTQAFTEMRGKLAQQVAELQDDNKRMATVLAGMVEGVLAVDARRRVLFVNEAGKAMLGLSSANHTGRNLLEVIRNVEIDAAVSQALAGRAVEQKEISIPGPPRRVLGVLATRLAAEPNPGVVVVLHDVSELRRLENLRRDFVANVSHELKTPLASIKAYAETLLLGAIHDPDNNVNFVSRICQQSERLDQLIVDLLHLARVEAGQESFEFSAVDVEAVVERGLIEHGQIAEQRRIELWSEPPLQPLSVWADPDGVFTIVSNLLSNAVRYTPEGGSVSVHWFGRDRSVVLEVRDTGIGIAPEDQQRIFERFFRAEKARSRELGGTGLGLSIVKHLAQAFGGSVGVQSELGSGSTFRVVLPMPPP